MANVHTFVRVIQTFLVAFIVAGSYSCQFNGNSDTNPPDPIPPVYDWTAQNSGSITNFSDIHFYNATSGWVVGEDNTILSTTTGGLTWPEAPVNSFEGNFRSVHLISESQGWIAGDKSGAPLDGHVYFSSNGGAYPEPQKTLEFPMNTVFNLDENHGWAGGENGQLLYTTDGGKNWHESTTNLDFAVNDIHFIDQNKGWAVGIQGNIIRSFDGGDSWQSEFNDQTFDLLSIHVVDSLTGWACGTNNTILIREKINETLQWTKQRIDNEVGSLVWRDIFFTDKQKGWIVGDDGAVYISIDGGKTWDKELTGAITDLNAIHMVSSTKGWIAGNEGIILTYTPLP